MVHDGDIALQLYQSCTNINILPQLWWLFSEYSHTIVHEFSLSNHQPASQPVANLYHNFYKAIMITIYLPTYHGSWHIQ